MWMINVFYNWNIGDVKVHANITLILETKELLKLTLANIAGIYPREANVATDLLAKWASRSWIKPKPWLKPPDDLCSALGHSLGLASVSCLLLPCVPKRMCASLTFIYQCLFSPQQIFLYDVPFLLGVSWLLGYWLCLWRLVY